MKFAFPHPVCATRALTLFFALALASPSVAGGSEPYELKPLKTTSRLDEMVELIGSRDIDADGTARIILADRIGMLTQQVAASSCALTSDIDVEAARAILEIATEEFERAVNALVNGDSKLNVHGPETNKRLLHDIEELVKEWNPTREAIDSVLADGHDVDASHIIDDHNLELLHLAHVLVADVSGLYSHPYELSQVDALVLKIAGRQRMLTQKMAKDACEIWTHYHEELAIPDLIETKAIFEDSMKALRFGLPAMGIPAAPTPEIEADLDRILDRWSIIRGNLDILVEGGELDEAGRTEVFHDLELELEELDLLVAHYTAYARRHH